MWLWMNIFLLHIIIAVECDYKWIQFIFLLHIIVTLECDYECKHSIFLLHIIIALECDYTKIQCIIVIYLLSYLLSEQENVGFLMHKPRLITHKINFVISSITMYKIWFLLWHILQDNLSLGTMYMLHKCLS